MMRFRYRFGSSNRSRKRVLVTSVLGWLLEGCSVHSWNNVVDFHKESLLCCYGAGITSLDAVEFP